MSGGLSRRQHFDTVVHLDNRTMLFEVGVQTGDDPHITVMYTDEDGVTRRVRYTQEQAGAVVFVIKTFDRRAVLEFANLLYMGVHEITVEESPAADDRPATVAEFTGLKVQGFGGERPLVRLTYTVGDSTRLHEVTPQAAADWSDILKAIDVEELPAIAQALYETGTTLGGE